MTSPTTPSVQQLIDRIDELEQQLQQITEENKLNKQAAHSQITSELQDRLAFIQTLFDTIPNPVFYKNIEGIYLGCNQSFADLILGITSEELIGCSLYDLPDVIPKKLADIYFEQDQNLFNNPGTQIYEIKVNCADNTVKDFIFYKSTYSGHDGEVAGLLGLMLDITERKKVQKNLEESEEKYRSMMESMADAVYICNPDLTIQYMNPEMVEQIGYDATGRSCHDVLHNLQVRCPWCVFPRVTDGETIDQEVYNKHDNRTYLVTNSPIHHLDGSISKMTIYRDISNRKQMENELILAKKIESTGVFAGGIAHDYNNLLFTILGNLLLIKQTAKLPPDSPASSLLTEAEDAAKKASKLTKRLLAFTHGEALTFEKCSITNCIEKMLEYFPTGKEYPVEIKHPPKLQSVYIDEGLFTVALRSILDNAKEAMTTGGPITITVNSKSIVEQSPLYKESLIEKLGEYIEIKIKDKGEGISEEILPKIFDPYFSTKKPGAQKGLGLGLATSYSIIRKHSGHIQIGHEENYGTVVTIYLPTWDPQSMNPNLSVTPGLKT